MQNKNNFKFIDLFAGIGGIRLGFSQVFGDNCIFSSEILIEQKGKIQEK